MLLQELGRRGIECWVDEYYTLARHLHLKLCREFDVNFHPLNFTNIKNYMHGRFLTNHSLSFLYNHDTPLPRIIRNFLIETPLC